MTYFVVPKDHSVLKALGKFDGLWKAQDFADKLHKETGEHFDIIHMAKVYSTFSMAEAFEQDLKP